MFETVYLLFFFLVLKLIKVITLEYIKGKYKSSIFDSSNGYCVGLFRVKEASEELQDMVNKTITFTGYFHELNSEDTYIFYGKNITHERYGMQFQVSSYERVEPEGTDAVVEFLTSSFVKGCGEKTAKKIVATLGDDAISLIKENRHSLEKCGLTERQVTSIYNSIMSYYDADETIIFLKGLGFSVKEITKLLSMYGTRSKKIVETDLYSLCEYIDFYRLDKVFFKMYDETNEMRLLACIIESMKRLSFEKGDVYSYQEEILSYMLYTFDIDLSENATNLFDKLMYQGEIKVVKDRFYLSENYHDELSIAENLYNIYKHNKLMTKNVDNLLEWTEKEYQIKYNEEQKKAIITALSNSVTIITGGPGTGKTTIINGLIRMFQYINGIRDQDMVKKVALLAPTGRASKRMSETTNFGASTIHRYLKWNHETKEFGVNEFNQNMHELIIVDEVSMIDNNLMASLLKGIDSYCKIILVGDENQLPSVGAGNVLHDIIASDFYPHVRLTNIYRQSENSYIPILAKEIKNCEVDEDIQYKKDDFNFLMCDRSQVKSLMKDIVLKSIDKGLTEKDMQILAPMYKGENGIDNLNIILQELFNPQTGNISEVKIGPLTYRVNDKIINLVNNVDQNIFNGDIGYIKSINPNKSSEFMIIDFYGNFVTIKREDIIQIRHAYAMSIHKSQGSEFNHVIMPLTKEYNKMLYNKLLYTGISRAKKSLVLIGSLEAFNYAVKNSYSVERKTNLTELIKYKFEK